MAIVGEIGIYTKGKYLCSNSRKITKEYRSWAAMIHRCSKGTRQLPTYVGCTVSENFKNFQYFAEWCNNQIGFVNKGWQLDKDILVKGNKVYSEETCCFVPSEINSLFVLRKARRGRLPLGVSYHKDIKKYSASISSGYKKIKTIGYFNSPEEAFFAYKKEKEVVIIKKANKWRSELDEKVYLALINWCVEIND